MEAHQIESSSRADARKTTRAKQRTRHEQLSTTATTAHLCCRIAISTHTTSTRTTHATKQSNKPFLLATRRCTVQAGASSSGCQCLVGRCPHEVRGTALDKAGGSSGARAPSAWLAQLQSSQAVGRAPRRREGARPRARGHGGAGALAALSSCP